MNNKIPNVNLVFTNIEFKNKNILLSNLNNQSWYFKSISTNSESKLNFFFFFNINTVSYVCVVIIKRFEIYQ